MVPLNLDAGKECSQRRAIKPDLLVIEMLSESCDDRLFDVEGRNSGYRSKLGCSGLSVQARLGDIVAVAHPGLGGVGCDHAMAGIVEQQVLQGVIGFLPGQNFVGLMPTAFAGQPRTGSCP